jgi:hypothetical protein
MISISRAGSMRSPVIVVGRFTLKFARNARGRVSNLYEAKLYRSVNATRRAIRTRTQRSLVGRPSSTPLALRRKTISWCRSTAFSASGLLFDLNGEASTAL